MGKDNSAWQPTNELRILRSARGDVLQQCFVEYDTGEEVWRDVPVVTATPRPRRTARGPAETY